MLLIVSVTVYVIKISIFGFILEDGVLYAITGSLLNFLHSVVFGKHVRCLLPSSHIYP